MNDEKIIYFYNQFKIIRKEKNISLSDILKKTKIQKKYIHAIEDGDFKTLPKVYTRLFLKSYSQAIGLDPEKIIMDYENHLSGKDNKKRISRTPKFIENKTHLNDDNGGQSSLLSNTYLIDSKKIIAIFFLVVFIISSWVILSTISKNRYDEYQTQFSNKKLSWEFFESLELLKSETIKPSVKGMPTNVRIAPVTIINGDININTLSAFPGIISSLVKSLIVSAKIWPIPPQNFFPPLKPKIPTSIGPNLSCINAATFLSK